MTLHDAPTQSILALVRAFLDATVAAPAEAMVDPHFADPAFIGDKAADLVSDYLIGVSSGIAGAPATRRGKTSWRCSPRAE